MASDREIEKLTESVNGENLNVVTLRDYIEAKLDGIAKSTEVALAVLDKRFDAINEIRGAMKDQMANFPTRIEVQSSVSQYRCNDLDELKKMSGKYISRDEHNIMMNRMESDVRMLRESRAELAGKASQLYVNITLAISIIGLAISILGLLRHT
jgi:hypothetical protein